VAPNTTATTDNNIASQTSTIIPSKISTTIDQTKSPDPIPVPVTTPRPTADQNEFEGESYYLADNWNPTIGDVNFSFDNSIDIGGGSLEFPGLPHLEISFKVEGEMLLYLHPLPSIITMALLILEHILTKFINNLE
jgi:hypothetical protein